MHATRTPATGHGRQLLDFQLEFYIFFALSILLHSTKILNCSISNALL
jgi:hypothetical protein